MLGSGEVEEFWLVVTEPFRFFSFSLYRLTKRVSNLLLVILSTWCFEQATLILVDRMGIEELDVGL